MLNYKFTRIALFNFKGIKEYYRKIAKSLKLFFVMLYVTHLCGLILKNNFIRNKDVYKTYLQSF